MSEKTTKKVSKKTAKKVSKKTEKEAKRIVSAICREVLEKCLKEAGIESIGVTGLNLDDPVDCISACVMALSSKDFKRVL